MHRYVFLTTASYFEKAISTVLTCPSTTHTIRLAQSSQLLRLFSLLRRAAILTGVGAMLASLGTGARAQGYTLNTLGSFNSTNGAYPRAGLTLGQNGVLYGTTEDGGAANDGTVYSITPGISGITTVAQFTNSVNAGQVPVGGVIMDSHGNLFGTTSAGGPNGNGTVYEVAAGSSIVSTLISFSGSNGSSPDAGVLMDSTGNLFGTTYTGGLGGGGTVFEVASGSSAINTLASFVGSNGEGPESAVIEDTHGNLYGTTVLDGSNDIGQVYEVAAGTNTLTTVASFTGTNGKYAYGGVIMDSHGNLFGTTDSGGTSNDGTVFEIAAESSSITTLASFTGANGANPYSALVLDSAGNLYGTTGAGGTGSDGTVFEVAAGSNSISTLASFAGNNGAEPLGGLTIDGSGKLYGTTILGGTGGYGTVFELTPTGSAATPEPCALVLALNAPTAFAILCRRKILLRNAS